MGFIGREQVAHRVGRLATLIRKRSKGSEQKIMTVAWIVEHVEKMNMAQHGACTDALLRFDNKAVVTQIALQITVEAINASRVDSILVVLIVVGTDRIECGLTKRNRSPGMHASTTASEAL
ncbi:MAG: hypothetical protein ACPGUV_10595, partial [Polyangiales bacterium]